MQNQQQGITLSILADIAGATLVNADAARGGITGISLDSASVQEGEIFAALPGTRVHGAQFAGSTAAAAILTDRKGLLILEDEGEQRPILVVEDIRSILGPVASYIFSDPSADLTVIGITGTSGKTTTSYLLEACLMAAGKKVGIIGTTGTRINGVKVPTSLTTPEAPTLQALFHQMLDSGVTHVVMEVSSHALMLGRVNGVHFDLAGFTNLSQDHLDFHRSMEEYFEAKALLFDPQSAIHASRAVINTDDEWGKKMLLRAGSLARALRTVDNYTSQSTHYEVTGIRSAKAGSQEFSFNSVPVVLPMPGRFNSANAGLALALVDSLGLDISAAVKGLATVGVPGRMERIDGGQDFLAVVDYAHKPAAVQAILETVRAQTQGRVGIVLGCGGDRDESKRAVMGQIAAGLSDLLVVTDDNPRSEDPAQIRQAMLTGAREEKESGDVIEIGDRRNAIEYAVNWAQPGDSIIIAGKGHEVGQLVNGVNHHFDDREELALAIEKRSRK
ncbi:UDP-N-acetylmuramoyl-L-alanyl-D-glutamate--2,6-diaminopimelate ligase [Corynebacterium sp. ES2794-CONJ1]|uniref:UDP-N-acetylmuramoyl-L-alanyl-D-glutamate--2, 6-diaminopimelate ligase n=1 Tax=unclassified Corynebacterium TaxID=2624378 RepID=UPI002166FAB0|nr:MULTISPECIES: UDP-N-acetylmuramoyl-L-alanyl-D-glutamate--2,6-diaminopimelate ligase [unclassified Corynebacterium]MCS4489010.1 UDP-N-acetylmuramoyl-L-alanyl-D-glutamate--2,6-diaminopimelate ligase [Corynebacterium sp. ES2775-CONJ]MCU9518663.1 UDP-N-acetylmuramoyl-L-alanyl-D-glutamate--2,6-diaminopimelate ligase [Corynebacterium sp. ES2794-CONJ1]